MLILSVSNLFRQLGNRHAHFLFILTYRLQFSLFFYDSYVCSVGFSISSPKVGTYMSCTQYVGIIIITYLLPIIII